VGRHRRVRLRERLPARPDREVPQSTTKAAAAARINGQRAGRSRRPQPSRRGAGHPRRQLAVDARRRPVSDLRNAIPLQDAINKTVLDMLIASEFAAFPQRVVLGVEAAKNPDGTPIADADIKLAISKLLTFKDPTRRSTSSKRADLKNYVTALEPLVQHFAGRPAPRRTTSSARSSTCPATR
jgi:hypothetical protein